MIEYGFPIEYEYVFFFFNMNSWIEYELNMIVIIYQDETKPTDVIPRKKPPVG